MGGYRDLKILFAEDQLEKNRDLYEVLSENFTVELAETAGEAYKKLKEAKYAMVILDIMMPPTGLPDAIKDNHPNGAGITVLNWLRKSNEKPKTSKTVPVLVITAIIDEDDIELVKSLLLPIPKADWADDELEPDDMLFGKPYDLDMIEEMAFRVLGLEQSGGQ